MSSEDREIDLVELCKTFISNRWMFVKFGAVGLCIGIVIAFSMPKVYNTTVTIAPEGSKDNSSVGSMSALAGIAGINLNSDIDGITSTIYPDIVESTPFLLEFADIQVSKDNEKMTFFHYVTKEQRQAWWSHVISAPFKLYGAIHNLFAEEVNTEVNINIFNPSVEQKKYIMFLHDNISVTADKKTNILTIAVDMQDALISATIADSITSRLKLFMIEYKTSKLRKNLSAKQNMLDEAKLDYFKAEDVLASGLDYNRNIISEKGRVKINRLTNEKDLAFNLYKQLSTQVEATKIQLQDQIPVVTIIEPASVAVRPLSPNKPSIAIIFTLLGIVVSAIIVLFKNDYFSPTKKD